MDARCGIQQCYVEPWAAASTYRLDRTNGAQLDATTFAQGNAGSVNIFARDTVSFDGWVAMEPSAVFSLVAKGAVGKGGGNIQTGSLSVSNGARLNASSEGNGAAGNIEVSASSIRLNNQAFLISNTTAGRQYQPALSGFGIASRQQYHHQRHWHSYRRQYNH